MRDLKHLIRFEELLRAANNELVQQAQAEGQDAEQAYDSLFHRHFSLRDQGSFP